MLIVPVIDLKDGVVVRGVAGRRDEYCPIESRIATDPLPATVARALVEHFARATVYVADLDAIRGGSLNLAAYREIAAAGMQLWLDAGIGDLAAAKRIRAVLVAIGVTAELIVGLESLASPAALGEIVAEIGARQTIFSLDLKAGKPLTSIAAWQSLAPAAIADEAVAQGVERMILLDLADVGTGRGTGTLGLCRDLRDRYPSLQLVTGGGVRGVEDLQQLAAAGASAALVASALHDGRLKRGDLDAHRKTSSGG